MGDSISLSSDVACEITIPASQPARGFFAPWTAHLEPSQVKSRTLAPASTRAWKYGAYDYLNILAHQVPPIGGAATFCTKAPGEHLRSSSRSLTHCCRGRPRLRFPVQVDEFPK